MNEEDLPFLQILFKDDEAPALPPPAPLALRPFRLANFQFASVHNGVIGSLYFADAGGHQRIRLVHNHNPRIYHYHPNGEWYFPPAGTVFPPGQAPTAVVDAWIANGGNPIPNAPVAGNQIIEYAAGHIDNAGRHKSRGVVSFPVITQNDINVVYNLITNGADNDELRQGILDNGLSPVLIQP